MSHSRPGDFYRARFCTRMPFRRNRVALTQSQLPRPTLAYHRAQDFPNLGRIDLQTDTSIALAKAATSGRLSGHPGSAVRARRRPVSMRRERAYEHDRQRVVTDLAGRILRAAGLADRPQDISRSLSASRAREGAVARCA